MLPPVLGDCTVLVVEDEPVQALDLEQSLLRLGCRVMGPVATQAEASRLLRARRPDLALLNLILADGPALPLVQELQALAVPLAAVSGGDAQLLGHPALQAVPLLRKPYNPSELWACLEELARRALLATVAGMERQIERACVIVHKQTLTIHRLALGGHDTDLAEALLRAYERSLALLEERRAGLVDRLER